MGDVETSPVLLIGRLGSNWRVTERSVRLERWQGRAFHARRCFALHRGGRKPVGRSVDRSPCATIFPLLVYVNVVYPITCNKKRHSHKFLEGVLGYSPKLGGNGEFTRPLKFWGRKYSLLRSCAETDFATSLDSLKPALKVALNPCKGVHLSECFQRASRRAWPRRVRLCFCGGKVGPMPSVGCDVRSW